ncbi:SHOCT domain-containing protein [Yinghuangia seranimata]|uniref:SHOCT domain-containing protein n=1 Tax=Yinghuangia seranimata TaxID=408067 RepID=UPI00248C2967|nr:SHOCT domain-containing protein [Yinghuangia seranimata]MDI2124990.1 SHOCT domain-containing protein [Yinghuangia seranimata]
MPGLIRGVARTAVVAGTATAVSNRVSRRQQGRWAEQEAAAAPPPPPAQYAEEPPAAPPDDTSDRLAQLKELGALKEQGVLTDAEFAEQKAKLLGS